MKILKNSNCDTTQKLKMWQNSMCDKTKKNNLWKNSNPQIVTKLKNSNCDNLQKFKLWQNSKNLKGNNAMYDSKVKVDFLLYLKGF